MIFIRPEELQFVVNNLRSPFVVSSFPGAPESPIIPVVQLPRLVSRDLPVLSLRPLVRVLFSALPYVDETHRLDN